MMSLKQSPLSSPVVTYDFFEAVKRQYVYKLNAYHSMFGTMILLQMIAVFLSIFGESAGTGQNNIYVQVNFYSANTIIFFTCIWAFMMALSLTNNASKSMMTTFVTNKQTNHLSNFLFMITLSVVGGITANLLGFFIKMIVFLFYRTEPKLVLLETIYVHDLFIGIYATILYILFVFVIGYFIGELVQFHRSLIIFIPVLLFGALIVFINSIEPIVTFYIFESSLIVFTVKLTVSIIVLFLISTQIGNRLEVRK